MVQQRMHFHLTDLRSGNGFAPTRGAARLAR
jgi:hypothetical protein